MLFCFFVGQDLKRCKHCAPEKGKQDREADEVTAKRLFKDRQDRVVGLSQEHIIRAEGKICDHGGDRKTDEDQKKTPRVTKTGIYLAACKEHQGIEREQDMYR